jgi:hypothetical protein
MINKVVYVPAHWEPTGKYRTVKVPTGEKGGVLLPLHGGSAEPLVQ